jgi:hypothetical protein
MALAAKDAEIADAERRWKEPAVAAAVPLLELLETHL